MAALAAPDLVVADLVAEHVTRAPARPGALVVVAELAAELVAAPLATGSSLCRHRAGVARGGPAGGRGRR